jgi:hypothetical protein
MRSSYESLSDFGRVIAENLNNGLLRKEKF